VDTGRAWAQHARMSEDAAPKPPGYAIGERVLVPSAQRVTTIAEIVLQGDTFGYRLAGLGQAVIAEAEIERISIDGRQKSPALTPRKPDG
jgi:hypothetical protein